MRTNVQAYVGGLTLPKCFLLSILLLILIPSVSASVFAPDPTGVDVFYNTSTQMASSVVPNTTPWEVWVASGLVGLVLFLYSIRPSKSIEDLEMSILVSVMSWISIGYCAYSSFAIDRIEGYGVTSVIVNNTSSSMYMANHLIYSQPTIGILMLVLFFVSVGYTIYRVSTHKDLLGSGDSE